jgi:hypothetical protein
MSLRFAAPLVACALLALALAWAPRPAVAAAPHGRTLSPAGIQRLARKIKRLRARHPGPRHPIAAASGGVWVSAAELAARPTAGPAWSRLVAAADGAWGPANIADQDSKHDVYTLAAALVYARTGQGRYRTKAAAGIAGAVGTERGGRTLALARNLASYVIAADLIDLRGFDPAAGARFAGWLDAVRTETLDGKTLISTHEVRPNNWGTMAGASRIAAALYLGDTADLARAADVFATYVGERSATRTFRFKDLSWQADPTRPLGINPVGAAKGGIDLDGALPDDLRRGCAIAPVPCHTVYPWEALQGVVVQAELLARHGYPAYTWGHEAVARAAGFLERLDRRFGGWWATGDDTWLPFVLSHAYGPRWPVPDRARPGKILGWTDWVYGA